MGLTGADAANEAAAQLEKLARELAGQSFETSITNKHGTPNLRVVRPEQRRLHEIITIGTTDDREWWFWWSWGDRIARVTDIETAAFKIAYVLTPQAGG